MADYDILGNIAIIKSEIDKRKKTKGEKLKEAEELLKHPGVESVLEKATNVKGRLRTIRTKYVLGKRNLVAELKENNSVFRFDIEGCYFSPRLANERQRIAQKIKSNEKVLVMFAGVGVYPIVIYKYAKPEKIFGVEIGKECCRYFKENLKLNRIPENRIGIIQGDVKKKINKKFTEKYGNFDVVVMARPNLKESFLKQGLIASKKGTRIFYYGFCKDEEVDKMINNLLKEAKKLKRKVKIKEKIPAGEIAPFKHRFRVEIEVLR